MAEDLRQEIFFTEDASSNLIYRLTEPVNTVSRYGNTGGILMSSETKKSVRALRQCAIQIEFRDTPPGTSPFVTVKGYQERRTVELLYNSGCHDSDYPGVPPFFRQNQDTVNRPAVTCFHHG